MIRKISPIKLAVMFHDTYERLSPKFGYETKEETKIFNAGSPNGKLMIEVCKEMQEYILDTLNPNNTLTRKKRGGMITKLAVRWLCSQLKKDKDYWYAWQSNIAMTISDNMSRYMPLRTNPDRILVERDELLGALERGYCSVTNSGKTVDPVLIEAMANELLSLNKNCKDASPDPLNKDYLPTQHEFCNICANDFLKLLTQR